MIVEILEIQWIVYDSCWLILFGSLTFAVSFLIFRIYLRIIIIFIVFWICNIIYLQLSAGIKLINLKSRDRVKNKLITEEIINWSNLLLSPSRIVQPTAKLFLETCSAQIKWVGTVEWKMARANEKLVIDELAYIFSTLQEEFDSCLQIGSQPFRNEMILELRAWTNKSPNCSHILTKTMINNIQST